MPDRRPVDNFAAGRWVNGCPLACRHRAPFGSLHERQSRPHPAAVRRRHRPRLRTACALPSVARLHQSRQQAGREPTAAEARAEKGIERDEDHADLHRARGRRRAPVLARGDERRQEERRAHLPERPDARLRGARQRGARGVPLEHDADVHAVGTEPYHRGRRDAAHRRACLPLAAGGELRRRRHAAEHELPRAGEGRVRAEVA